MLHRCQRSLACMKICGTQSVRLHVTDAQAAEHAHVDTDYPIIPFPIEARTPKAYTINRPTPSRLLHQPYPNGRRTLSLKRTIICWLNRRDDEPKARPSKHTTILLDANHRLRISSLRCWHSCCPSQLPGVRKLRRDLSRSFPRGPHKFLLSQRGR